MNRVTSITEDEMDRSCSTYETDGKRIKILAGKPEGKRTLPISSIGGLL
jgi:hypothetical protein